MGARSAELSPWRRKRGWRALVAGALRASSDGGSDFRCRKGRDKGVRFWPVDDSAFDRAFAGLADPCTAWAVDDDEDASEPDDGDI